MKEKVMTKNDLREMLSNDEVDVVFTKVGGSQRTMRATLDNDRIPQSLAPHEEKKATKQADRALAVWDVHNNGWRSFRWDSVSEVNGTKTQIV
jgi:hypothetical protein